MVLELKGLEYGERLKEVGVYWLSISGLNIDKSYKQLADVAL